MPYTPGQREQVARTPRRRTAERLPSRRSSGGGCGPACRAQGPKSRNCDWEKRRSTADPSRRKAPASAEKIACGEFCGFAVVAASVVAFRIVARATHGLHGACEFCTRTP